MIVNRDRDLRDFWMDAHGRSWTLAAHLSDAGRTNFGRLRTFGKFGHATARDGHGHASESLEILYVFSK
jgi:hypothetical protein